MAMKKSELHQTNRPRANLPTTVNRVTDRVHSTPSKTRQIRPTSVHLTGSAVQELAQNLSEDQRNNLEQSTGTERQSLEDNVGNVEIGRLRNLLGQQRGSRRRVVDDGSHNTGGRRGESNHQEDLHNLESEEPVLNGQFNGGSCWDHHPTWPSSEE